MFKRVKKIHFVGIGGSGMNGIAEILLNMGYKISGSDINQSEVTERLKSLGAEISYGHSPENIQYADVLVVSSAVKGDNCEIKAAATEGTPIIPRAEMLAELMRMKYGVAIAGTHGKSTTTSITGEMLAAADLDPTIIVGGKVVNLESSVKLGKGTYLVAEADEYDKSFLKLAPTIAVVTNLEPEHMECYTNFDDLRYAFLEFINKVPFYGAAILCYDDKILKQLIPEIDKRVITYGLSSEANLRAVKISFAENHSKFDVVALDENIGTIETNLIGLHNVKNTLAAIAVGLELGIDFQIIRKALAEFSGVYRRFQIKEKVDDILVVDDFAHHPTELRVTLQAAKLGFNRRIVAVFQPHLYSRTQNFYQEFGKALMYADEIIITRIYPARETPIEGVSAKLIYDAAKDFGHMKVHYIPEKEEIPQRLTEIVQNGDLLITLGAGNIYKIGEEFIQLFKNRHDSIRPGESNDE